ncbi:MAG: DUF3299 domain-containing protein [Flavobacteriales bacterium]|nr:DUF3299 domain-containing protein [Flavobacteriales bacterium]
MVKKIFFVITGIIIAVGTYGFIRHEKKEELPAKAKQVIDWTYGRQLFVAPIFQEGKVLELTWHTLTDVTFKDVYVADLDMYYWKPTFGPSVKAMEGKDVYITGYVIPVDYDENFYVVSRYPYANCYFCGGGGPESVVDLRFAGKNRTYKTDERLTFKGKLRLNASDIYQMNYILDGAVEYSPQ